MEENGPLWANDVLGENMWRPQETMLQACKAPKTNQRNEV
jgi:hypothetical protein